MPRHPQWYGKWLLPREVDLSRTAFMPAVLDQGDMGTCTANAAANAMVYALGKEARMKNPFQPRWGEQAWDFSCTRGGLACVAGWDVWLAVGRGMQANMRTGSSASEWTLTCANCSRLFIYYNAKKFIANKPVVYNGDAAGASIRQVFKSVEQYGACVEELFPYSAHTAQFTPNSGVFYCWDPTV